jgi:hypothetical protein
MARLYNQSKNQLGWSMGGVAYSCEPWGVVEIADELVSAAVSRGLPLGPVQVSPEERAQVRIADERAASDQAPLLALKAQLEQAQASEREARAELGRVSVDLSTAKNALREAGELNEKLGDKVRRLESDKAAAEQLLTEADKRATDAEARAIKSEALLTERDKPKKQKQTEAGA